MQHYQVPSAEYSSYINHVISLGLAEDYIAQLHASCSSNSPPPLRAAINQACRHLSGVVDDLQPVPVSVRGVPSLETLGQQNGAPVPDAALGLAAAMLNTPEEEARILKCTQLINARHGAAKPQNTVQAEKSAAKLWRVGDAWPLLMFLWRPRGFKAMSLTHIWSCRDTVSRRRTGSLMATPCLRPRFLNSRCGLWMRHCNRMVLATRSAVLGERPLHCCV